MQETTTPNVEFEDHNQLERLKCLIDWAMKYQTEKAELLTPVMEAMGEVQN